MFVMVCMNGGWIDYKIFVGCSWAIASTTCAIFRHQKAKAGAMRSFWGWSDVFYLPASHVN
jgi:hypothetical protein